MKVPNELFHIEIEHLGDKKIFPFHLYVYNPQSQSYSPYLFANSPMGNDKFEFINFIIEKGGELAIDKKQKRTFLHEMELKEEDIPSLREKELSEIEKKRLEKIKKKKEALELKQQQSPDAMEEGESKYDLKDGLSACLKADNFLPMIMAAREEIEIFELTTSHTVSLAAYLAENLLTEDNFTNRIVAFSYFMTKNMDMTDQETLSDIVCASFFAHLGYTQLDYTISHTPHLELTEKQRKKHEKHPGYSHHMLVKSGVEISDRCKNIIFQHHELYGGQGYPNQKRGEFIDVLSLILGAVTHIFEFSTGRVNGSSLPLELVINRLKNKTFTSGLEFDFGDKIYENLIYLINIENNKEAA
jgi:HD-GYP domain-containing protein (c-di-GMP phosphodiesterase class II)